MAKTQVCRRAMCLSVCQPFAELIVSGAKRIELRGWRTEHRGELFIHAPQKVRRTECRRLGLDGPFVRGAIVGLVDLDHIIEYDSASDLRADIHLHCAPGVKARYGYVLKRPRRLRIPIPYKGRLGIFGIDVPSGVPSGRQVRDDLAEEEHRYGLVGWH